MLEFEQEQRLAHRFRDESDTRAADQLVNSHLRLVAKIAMGYRGYGLPLADLISEGNVGMMHAMHRFDPDRGHLCDLVNPCGHPGIHHAVLVGGLHGPAS